MIRSYRYPLHPTKAQEATLIFWLAACCDLYNAALQERRDAHRLQGVSIGYNAQTESLTEIRADDERMEAVPVDVARSALNRVKLAFDGFFRRVKENRERGTHKPVGYPRFKPKQRYCSFSIGAGAAHSPRLIQGKHVKLPKLGKVKFNQYRPIPEGAKVLDVIVRRDLDKWYVVFQCDLGAAPAKPDVTTIPLSRQVGIDVGLSALATLSTGEVIPNPRHGRDMAAVLARRQRALARKKRGSKSRRKALLLVQKAHATIENRRKDHHRKAAATLVRSYDLICMEDLAIAKMVHGTLAFSFHDAGCGGLRRCIEHKAESAGAHVVVSDPAGTTIECSRCGVRVPKTLAERTHRCACGLVLGRDHNAALNILARGRRAVGLPAIPLVTAEGFRPCLV